MKEFGDCFSASRGGVFGFDVGLEGAWLKINVRLKGVTSRAEMERALSGGSGREIRRARENMAGA